MSGRKTLKQILMSLLGGVLFLTACGQTSSAIQTVPVPAVDKATATSSPIPTNTSTPVPTETPTATITSLPAIPTFTPTFDASTIISVTQAPKAQCPKENPSLKPDFQLDYYSNDADHKIPEFLRKGGAISIMVNEISKVYYEYSYRFIDVTNDKKPELIFDGFTKLYDTFYILRCQTGRYVVFSGQDTMGVSEGFTIYKIVDMNKNGVPEIVIYARGCTGNGCYRFFIGEWNGKTFINLAPEIYLEGVNEGEIELKDINNDGTLELILVGGSYDFDTPWRQSIHTYMWNGNNFVEQSIEYLQPVYRFQSIQDADATVISGKYEKAIQLYEEAISKKNLEWWSPKRQKYEQGKMDSVWLNEPTPSVMPTEDPAEYPRLAAYAYYRIMLLHLVQGNEADAITTYNTLQQKFGNDPYGQPYVETATAFWNAYQSTHKMYDGCAEAIQYAAEHPEILIPLGSDYHGSQSHIYVPADVCPFR
jgi:tetratricopeptide (TPR) repeat protein